MGFRDWHQVEGDMMRDLQDNIGADGLGDLRRVKSSGPLLDTEIWEA